MIINVIDNLTYKGTSKDRTIIVPINIYNSRNIDSTQAIIDIHIISYFAKRVPSTVLSDLLIFSAEVYAIDRALIRNVYSVDGWSRILNVTFKVQDSQKFNEQKNIIDAMLGFLTGDYWDCHFENLPRIEWNDEACNATDFSEISQVNLFSGGMDSLIGAIDYMEQHDSHHKLFLASHYDSKMGGPKIDQHKIEEKFSKKYSGKYIYTSPVGITPLISNEMTCRSRSLMFLSIAILVAAYSSCNVIVPENGSVSLNYPLSASRRAACSTRTTHPIFLDQLRQLLYNWHIEVEIKNPYEFKTKGEMVQNCKNIQYLLSIVQLSNSCGKRSQHQFMLDNPHATHCGRCMPCMYRKASLINFQDPTTYGITMATLFRQNKKISNDFYAMLNYLRHNLSDDEIGKELLIMGIKKSDRHFLDYIDLVKRTREELKTLIKKEAPEEVRIYAGL